MNEVALLIPHYNNPEGLIKSLQSIESSENIDVFIIDDGSTKYKINENEIRDAFKAKGEIYFNYLTENKGIEHALNHGIDLISQNKPYKYIARLDCGDICVGNRFQIQETFLNKNPKIKLVGANIICTDVKGNFLYKMTYPNDSSSIAKRMHLNSMFSHPCTMFCTEVIPKIGKYPTNYKSAEDYAFFFKIVKEFQTANIDQTLLKYEINPNGISISKRKEQVKSRLRIMMKHFYFGFWPIYGLLRSMFLYILPYSFIFNIKKRIK